MCNRYANRIPPSLYEEEFSHLRIPLRWPEGGVPNIEPREDITIGDTAPVVTRDGATDESDDRSGAVALRLLPWAWKGPGGKPVFNFRSEGRRFSGSTRCLVPADAFYEFTTPAELPGQPKARRKDKWRFQLAGEPWFWIAGLVRDGAFALLTTAPGPDIAPYHDRQIVLLRRDQAMDWLTLTRPEADLLRPCAAGALTVARVGA